MGKTVFVSHRSLDGLLASRISDLVTASGMRVYLDERDPATRGSSSRRELREAIDRALNEATHMIAIISPFSRNSDWVPYEIGVARQRGVSVAAVVQKGVREPEYLDSLSVLRSAEELVDWLASFGSRSADDDLVGEIDTWFESGASERAPLYRSAIDHIESLWDPRTWVALRLDDERYAFAGRWMGCASGELIHILYSLIAPLVVLYPRTAGLSELERTIVEAVYRSFADDEVFARIEPVQVYEARRCKNWRSLRQDDPRRYWLQGLLPRDLDDARDAFRDESGDLLSREDLASKYMALYRGSDGAAQKPLGLAANALQGFELRSRPVFARLLAAQLRMYSALLRIELEGEVAVPRSELFELSAHSRLAGTEEAEVSRLYLTQRLLPEFARAIGADPAEFMGGAGCRAE